MPFQDVEDVPTTEYSGPPGFVVLWFRRIFIEDWGLKLLALAISLFLWLGVTEANKPLTIRRGIQLSFIRPENLEISNDPMKNVDVLLTGSRDKLSGVDLVATVDLSDLQEGERVVRLSPGRVQMDLPNGVRIESFQPSTIPIHLEPIVQRLVVVDVKLEGKPAAGQEVYAVRASPETITVRGPLGHVNGLQRAPTETISVEGRKESFTAAHTAMDVPDHKVDLVDATVDVTIEIGPRRTERTFTSVPVITAQGGTAQPKSASVTLFGPASDLDQLRVEDIKIILGPNSQGSPETRLNLPPAVQDRVILKSIKPSQFSVNR